MSRRLELLEQLQRSVDGKGFEPHVRHEIALTLRSKLAFPHKAVRGR